MRGRETGLRNRTAAAALLALLLAIPLPASALEYEVWTPPKVGDDLPDFALRDTAGKEVRLSSWWGDVILLSFWSCFSDTCFTSIPALEELLKRFGPSGLVAPTVCTEVTPALAADGYRGLIERCGRGQVILLDEKKEMKKRFHVLHYPTAFLVGRDFKIKEIVVDMHRLRDPKFGERVEQLVQESAPRAPAAP